MKLCRGCNRRKPYSEFHRRSATPDGCQSKCKSCKMKQNRAWERANPEALRAKEKRSRIKREYGLTLEEYEKIVARGCSVCGKIKGKICVDHNHDTGEIRGALCDSCNRGIGLLGDNVERLKASIDYLEGKVLAYA